MNLTQLLEQFIKRNVVRKPGLPTENPWIEADSLANTPEQNSASDLSFSGPFFPYLNLSIRLKSENREEVMDERGCFCSLTHLPCLAKYSKQIQTSNIWNWIMFCSVSLVDNKSDEANCQGSVTVQSAGQVVLLPLGHEERHVSEPRAVWLHCWHEEDIQKIIM